MDFNDYEIRSFKDGMTDNFIGREKTRYQKAWNCLVTVDEKLRTRDGSIVDGTTDTQAKISAGVEFLLTPLTTTEKPYKLTTDSNFGKLFYYNGSTHAELLGPTSNHLFDTTHGTGGDHRFTATPWNDHAYITSTSFTQKVQKIWNDGSSVLQLRTAGLPKYAGSNATITGAGSGAITYLIALVFKYTYITAGRTFVTRGPLFRQTISAAANPPTSIIIPANGKLSNTTGGALDNYDTGVAGMVLEYYRTIGNGTEYYLVGTQQNSTIDGIVTITDGVADATLLLNQVIYTSGGVAENDPPPVSKYIHVTERGTCYYGWVQDGSDAIKNRIRQSKVGIPDAAPTRFFDDLDEGVTGISSYRGLPLFFGANSVYRGDGVFDSFGQGELVAQRIANYAGCVSHNGIVQTYFGVFFPSANGFYWTNGYDVVKISDEINSTYASVYATDTAKAAISGCYDEINQLVYWTFADTTTSDGCFVLHLRYGIKADSVFTQIGGNSLTTSSDATLYPTTIPTTITQNFRAKSVLAYNRKIYRADNRGYTMYFDATTRSDPRVVTGTNVSAWGTTYVYYDFRTVALSFDNLLARKWTPSVVATFKNVGNISASLRRDRDLLGNFATMREIKQKTNFSWGDAGAVWGDPVLFSSDRSLFIENRRMNTPGIRCSYRTLRLTNALTVIQKSDSSGLGTVDSGAKTLTIASDTFLADLLDYYVTFGNDNYLAHYLITARTSTVLTFSDPSGICPSGSQKWEVKGYAKTDGMALESLVMPVAYLTDSQQPYQANEEGANA